MERDFMGLGSRDNIVKEEAVEECKELGFLAFSKASAAQRPSSNEALVPPHFMVFKPATDENTVKPVPTPELQKVDNGPRGSSFSVPNQAISASMSNFRSHFGGSVTMKQQSIGGSPVLRPYPMHPFFSSVSGGAETRFNSKPSESPQLTIFYGGTVNVFDNVSPEKAQAILFLAGNSSTKVSQPRPQTQPPVSKQGGGVHLQATNTTPNSGIPSPITISSHPIVQSGESSRSKDEIAPTPIKPLAVLGTPKIPTSTTVIHSAVPQARKASLARFLEKRKERATSSAPYNLGKILPECAPSGSNNQ